MGDELANEEGPREVQTALNYLVPADFHFSVCVLENLTFSSHG